MILKISAPMLLAGCVMMCGCLGPRISYKGEQLTPTSAVKLIPNTDQLKNYSPIGKATVSGAYERFSYDELVKDLEKKACAVGADAVYIRSYEVIPSGSERIDQAMNMTPDNAWSSDVDSDSGWSYLQQDMDYQYGEVLGNPNVAMKTDTPTYRRVIKAIFLKRKK